MGENFILSNIKYDSFAKPGVEDEYKAPNKIIEKHFDYNKGGKYWSYALMRSGTNQNTNINPTGVPGYIMNIYYSMMFEFPKDQWRVVKKSETIDVTPVHHQYYQITHGQKEALEAKIREGMVKISQSIADLELVQHDLIKYEDFEKKFKERELDPDEKGITPEEKEDREKKRNAAIMELKTTFVDEVDFHAGGGTQGAGRLSMAFMRNNNIMPTIVDDFFRMTSKESIKTDPGLMNIPVVEQRMLEVKFQAYEDWLGYFKGNVTRRMEALRILKKSREKTLDEYREWMKPTIARYKMIVDSLENASERLGAMSLRVRTSGVATSFNNITIWMWKSFIPPDPHRPPQELIEKSGVRAIGDWEYKNFYFHHKHGLVVDYPWITKDWIKAKLKLDDEGYIKLPADERIGESSWYYSFMEITLGRSNIKTSATGAELEDGDFFVTNYMMSKNVLVAKYLELKAYEENDMEIYIDDMLGLKHKVPGKPIVFFKKEEGKYSIDSDRYKKLEKYAFMDGDKKITLPADPGKMDSKKDLERHFLKDKKGKKKDLVVELIEYPGKEKKKRDEFLKNVKENLGLGTVRFFLPGGPYEQNWNERIKKIYLKPNSGRFEYVANFIKSKMNIGGGA